MSDLKNNEIRITISATVNEGVLDGMEVHDAYGNDVPKSDADREACVAAILARATASTYKEIGVPHFMAKSVLEFTLENTYIEEGSEA